MNDSMDSLERDLIRHEGLCLKPYKCPAGKLTIGIGRNLEDTGITEAEAMFLLRNDINRCWCEAITTFSWFHVVDYKRQKVIINMLFNMGMKTLLGFKKMINALSEHDYSSAADEMLDSLWSKQVGYRAIELAEVMRNGE